MFLSNFRVRLAQNVLPRTSSDSAGPSDGHQHGIHANDRPSTSVDACRYAHTTREYNFLTLCAGLVGMLRLTDGTCPGNYAN